MPLAKDAPSTNAMGGSELMKLGLIDRLEKNALDDFQLFVSRVEEPLDETKIRIFWGHDLPGDPASDVLKDEGWNKFHKLVFVSNWQQQAYINYYRIPWSHCIVLQNAIEPISWEPWFHGSPVNNPDGKLKNPTKWDDTGIIKLIYTPTPHRGLNILVPVFDKLCEKYDNLELDVYSSFALYGWEERDHEFEPLFNFCKQHPKINYHGAVPNDEVRKALQRAHIFSYPSTWPETFCLSLIEAMSAGCVCVHSNYGGLPETGANWTHMYSYTEDLQDHAKMFYTILSAAIDDIVSNPLGMSTRLQTQKSYVDIFYSWTNRVVQWKALLEQLKGSVKDTGLPKSVPMFKYSTP